MSAYPTKPSQVATLEQELVRLILAYQDCNPRTAMLEDLNNNQLSAQWQIKQTPAGDTIFVGRCTIVLDRTNLTDTSSKPWIKALETPGGAVVPSGYLSN
ncbi:MAG: hypothetical protein KME45_11525 [Stenomitos rutilans HA7619-LM2]|jgi:hypothetical protein|nr:hypothetical protein [Stenomitos rutilans HA7619-LM2]